MPFWKDPSRRLLSRDDEARIVEAIRHAESTTSGEIRVHIEDRCDGDPMAQARVCFAALGMTATAARNGVLLYLAVDDRKFAIVGDEGIHTRVGDSFWDGLRDKLEARLRDGQAGEGIVETVTAIGRALAGPFPSAGDDRNELPDAISWKQTGDPG